MTEPSEVQALAEAVEAAMDSIGATFGQRERYGHFAEALHDRGVRVAPSPTEDPVTCASCLCVVPEVDAETGECRACYGPAVAPSPDAPGLREAIEEIRGTGTDCPAAMQPESFYRQQLHRVIGIATRAALAATGNPECWCLIETATHPGAGINPFCPQHGSASESHPTKERTDG